MNFWVKIGLALAAIWVLAGAAIYWAHVSQPTAKSTADFLDHANLSANRSGKINKAESMLNSLPFEERQQLDRTGATRRFFSSLRPEEQGDFLDATLPAGFKQLMDSFNRMEPERRKHLVQNAVDQMKQHEGDAPPRRAGDDQLAQRVIDQGLKSYYTDASPETKLDLAPLIEQMQHNLRAGGGQ